MKRVLAALALGCHACAGPPARALAPTTEELKNMTYAGLDERSGPVTLQNGRWAGDPPLAGAASRPMVELADSSRVVGDLDGDGAEEAVVLLTYSAGGSATWSFLAVVARENGTLRNVATTALGDRVQVRSARIEGGRLLVSGVRAGPSDPACCPSDLVEWQWTLGAGRLNALAITSTTGPFTYACTRAAGGSDTLRATFYQTQPATVQVERRGATRSAFAVPAGSGAKYEGPDVLFWDWHGVEALVTWSGEDLTCKRR